MKRRRPARLTAVQEEAAAVRTGEHCPDSGWWYPVQRDMDATLMLGRFVAEGNVMPTVGGAPALWLPRTPLPETAALQDNSR